MIGRFSIVRPFGEWNSSGAFRSDCVVSLVVILDRTMNNSSIMNIISDSSKLKQIKADPPITRESKLQRILRFLKRESV